MVFFVNFVAVMHQFIDNMNSYQRLMVHTLDINTYRDNLVGTD